MNQHQNMDQKGNGKGGKGGKRHHPIKNKQGQFVTTRARSASALPPAQTATHARHRARKDVRMCVRDACSLTETRHVQREEQIDFLPSPRRHGLQVRQTVCLRLLLVRVLLLSRSLEKELGSHKLLPTSLVGKTFNHLTSDVVEDATFSKLVENADRSACCCYTLRRSTRRSRRRGHQEGGPVSLWLFSLVCVPFVSQWKATKRVASVTVVVSLCVFPQCHRWEAGNKRVSQDSSMSVKTQVRPMKLGASKRVLPRFRERVSSRQATSCTYT